MQQSRHSETENSVNGMIITDKSDFDCKVCALGKMTDNRSRKPDETAKQPLDVVHIDLAGPVEPEDTNGMNEIPPSMC